MPTGDICTKQRKLSGYRWILKFNFASGFYAVHIPVTLRLYLAFYTKSREFLTQKRMPFGLTGSLATFHMVTSDCLGDLLSEIQMELIVDDAGMASNDFNEVIR